MCRSTNSPVGNKGVFPRGMQHVFIMGTVHSSLQVSTVPTELPGKLLWLYNGSYRIPFPCYRHSFQVIRNKWQLPMNS